MNGDLWRPYRFEQRPFSKGIETMWFRPESTFEEIEKKLNASWWIYSPRGHLPMRFVHRCQVISHNVKIMTLDFEDDDVVYVFLDLPPDCYLFHRNCLALRDELRVCTSIEEAEGHLRAANGFLEGAERSAKTGTPDRTKKSLGLMRRMVLDRSWQGLALILDTISVAPDSRTQLAVAIRNDPRRFLSSLLVDESAFDLAVIQRAANSFLNAVASESRKG